MFCLIHPFCWSRLSSYRYFFRVHVRRTDKIGTEAAFHRLDEYMVQVEEYYKMLSQRKKVTEKRVFLATDDPTLLDEAKLK